MLFVIIMIFCTQQHHKLQLAGIGNFLSPDTGMTFTSTPSSIIPPFSKVLDMKCELGELPDVKHIVSIGITRGGQRIASISDYHPAQADSDLHKIKVEGDTSGTSGR